MNKFPVISRPPHGPSARVIGILLSLSTVPVVAAQAPTTAPAAEASRLSQELADVPGVQAGMSVDALLDVAAKMLQSGGFADAQRILDAVIKQESENVRAMALLAASYERQAQLKKDSTDPAEVEKADGFLQKAIDVYIVLAPLRAKVGEYREAEQMFTRILLHRPNHAPSQLELARLLAETGRQLLAIDRYREYMKNPAAPVDSIAEVNIELGRLYRGLKMYAQAVTMLLAAQKLNPENPEVHIELALTYRATSAWDKAKIAADTAISKSRDNPVYYDVVATILLAQGDLANALLASRQSIDLARAKLTRQSDDQESWHSLDGYYRTNEQVLRAMLGKQNSAAARIDLVRVIQQRTNVSEVLSAYVQLNVLRAVPEAESGNPRLLELKAELEMSLSKRDDAAATCKRLLEIEPRNALARQILDNLSQSQTNSPTTQSVVNAPAAAP